MKKIISGVMTVFLIGLVIYIFGVIICTASMLMGMNETLTWDNVLIIPFEVIKIISVALTAMGLCFGIIIAIIFIGADIKKRQRLNKIHKK